VRDRFASTQTSAKSGNFPSSLKGKLLASLSKKEALTCEYPDTQQTNVNRLTFRQNIPAG
jgi:hypothetical protein